MAASHCCCSSSLSFAGSRHTLLSPHRRSSSSSSSHLLLFTPALRFSSSHLLPFTPALRSPPLPLPFPFPRRLSLLPPVRSQSPHPGPATAAGGKRTDIKKILILGAGPIVIGQACEFDYSGTQAVKALRDEGYEVVLVNSNPATIMTDPDLAHRTYVGPMTPEIVEEIISTERPDALLPTMGGQTALNLAVALSESGALDRYNVELIGAKLDAIKKAEDRDLFKKAMAAIGLKTPPSGIGNTMEECSAIADEIGGFPLIIRPAFTLGGTGGGIAYNKDEFEEICQKGLAASLTSQVLVEKSLLGWKEYELEVMRDLADNAVIICSIENIDPMGVHTGDSITVAPAQTLTDKEYQRLRDYSIAIIREIGVECGGSNVQFAVNPEDGEVMVIEMNPRVSRSSALASKATGFPIAKIAAKLSVGYTLDQIPNDITKKTPASFEPSIDYVVTKIPRFAFEKFPGSEPVLTTQMKSVGEAMALGRTFQESFQKAVRSLECGYAGWGCAPIKELDLEWEKLKYSLRTPNPERIHAIYAAMKRGMKVEEIHELSYIDKWFLTELKELVEVEQFLMATNLDQLTKEDMYEVKRRGFSDEQIAYATSSSEEHVRSKRLSLGVSPAYKRVDTCAAEFEANTPYMYSSYDFECESAPTQKKKVLILGGGPNRIGQGIEFDYCCCHASFALRQNGYETIMMNSNPETVSTDYDTSDRLYFEPLTVEDVSNVIDLEKPDGIIVQFGGQTPLKLALPLQRYLEERKFVSASGTGHVQVWGTSPDSIDAAEDRERFNAILNELQIEQPKGGIAKSESDAKAIATSIGYPVVVRPSYVLGGRAMEIVYNDDKLISYLENAVEVDPERPVLIDKYLSDAIEIDVDALADSYGNVVIGGIMEHIEQAGVHSGDSACSLPTKTVSAKCLDTIRSWTLKLAKRLNVCGLMNCQYAITVSGDVYLLEANPRASRTVPFVSKAIGHPLAEPETEPEYEAGRLKSIAESKLQSSDFKSALKYARRARRLDPNLDGLSLLVTALKILRCSPSDHYKILRLDPFSPPSLIRSQYKTLALSLHPDKSPGLEEAFKRVADSFRFLSDRSNKKRFDDDLRVRIAGEKAAQAAEVAADRPVETFWTACDTCRILHEFDRRYVGHRLVCPSCRKSFLAAEMKEEAEEEEEEENGDARVGARATGARSRSRSRPRVSINWGDGVKKRKVGGFACSELKKPNVRKEKTLAEIQLELTKSKMKIKEKKKEMSGKACVPVEEEEEEEEDLSLMAVEDSDFHDFDKDRTEKSFVKGQVWAVYDDDDGMPRLYGLIDGVLSSNPFRVKMCWLDVQNNGDEALLLWEKSGHHISCGRFKVGRKVDIDSVNFFSHLVECERAAKELYRIYPKKGSVWALYGKGSGGDEEGRCYDIVVFLTSYSEMYGLSMAHLEKVEGYKSVFKRLKTGAHAVTWLEKEDVRLFSHQIPARKLLGEEDENLPRECWELDPASLPSEVLADRGRKRLT